MTDDVTRTRIAANHFGMGARQDDDAAVRDAPQEWLHAQISPGADVRLDSGVAAGAHATESSVKLLALSIERAAERRALKRDVEKGVRTADEGTALNVRQRTTERQAIKVQARTRLRRAVATAAPFRERLVRFWSNHFTVSRSGRRMIATSCLAYENEAIRSHLDGTFSDMLLAVVEHPVMLIYLDNVRSVGPNSATASRKRKRGLNENLAREVLELHTLGVHGGYAQEDVIALANMLTGWNVGRDAAKPMQHGRFVFSEAQHEPGSQQLMGERFAEGGLEQATFALRFLSRHDATARFVATKLARHFVADEPPTDAVDALEKVFLDSDGHLPTLHAALVDLPGAWEASRAKFKTPQELAVSVARGLNLLAGDDETADERAMQALHRLVKHQQQAPFTAPSPAGWADTAAVWAAPAAVLHRVEWGIHLGKRFGSGVDARALLPTLLPGASPTLTTELDRAESPDQALGLLLASPEFQWRA